MLFMEALYVLDPKGVDEDENVVVPGDSTSMFHKLVPPKKSADPLNNTPPTSKISPKAPATSVTATLAETNWSPTGTVNANESKSRIPLILPVTVFVPTSSAMIG